MRIALSLTTFLLASALGACQSNNATASTAPALSAEAEANMNQPATTPDEIAMGCSASDAGPIMGKEPTPEIIELAKKNASAKVVRVLKAGAPMTMEYNGARLNVFLDTTGKIKGVNCG